MHLVDFHILNRTEKDHEVQPYESVELKDVIPADEKQGTATEKWACYPDTRKEKDRDESRRHIGKLDAQIAISGRINLHGDRVGRALQHLPTGWQTLM
ncbi:hypothetical protein CEP54_014635 [Fusarium duplospermum]|uniref:Uncharacterized protein n=1 Tax=Fusarium duplospermum TaxID=1325734 RepID=A0A428NUV9_9HYPO|nr:hypothetical protein CEP54_014635 [Fusarium duplospermum]